MTQPLLSIRNVAKQYGQHTALAGVSFDVAAGELFGLLGPNGAGKTTLLSIVSCLLEASAGEAPIMGQKASTHDRTCGARSASFRKSWRSMANSTPARI